MDARAQEIRIKRERPPAPKDPESFGPQRARRDGQAAAGIGRPGLTAASMLSLVVRQPSPSAIPTSSSYSCIQ